MIIYTTYKSICNIRRSMLFSKNRVLIVLEVKVGRLTSSPASAEGCPALPPPAPQQPARHTRCAAHLTGMISWTDTSASAPPHASTRCFSEGEETSERNWGFLGGFFGHGNKKTYYKVQFVNIIAISIMN